MIVESDEIEGFHRLPLESNAISEQLQRVVKTIKCRCDDNNIDKIPHLKYLREVIKCVNERENEQKKQTRKSFRVLVKGSSSRKNFLYRVILVQIGSCSTIYLKFIGN